MFPTIDVVDETEVDEELDRRIRHLLTLCFPDWKEIFKERRTWHNTKPICSVLGFEDETLIAHISLVVRTITTTWNFRYNVASFQGVCVSPDQRRHGLGKRMLQTAIDEATRRGFPYAILFCKEPLVPYYTGQGWRLADDSMVMWNNRDLPIAMRSNCPMYYELTDVPFPEGPLDVHSPSWS